MLFLLKNLHNSFKNCIFAKQSQYGASQQASLIYAFTRNLNIFNVKSKPTTD